VSVHADIIGAWSFDSGAGKEVTDVSGRNHTGQLIDGAKFGAGKFGRGIELDSSSFIEWEHHEDFNFEENLTIMLHARIDAIVPQDYVGLPRKEEEYVMAAHKLGNTMEMGIWINIGGWQGPIFAEAVQCQNRK